MEEVEEIENQRNLYKKIKHQTVTVIHYTVTTNQGIKRYLSCLLSKELTMEEGGIIEIRPFVFCMVQSIPSFVSSRDYFLEGIHRRLMMPHFKNFFLTSSNPS